MDNRRDREPYWPYCNGGLYPLPEGVRDCFAQNVVRAVDICLNAPPILSSIQPTLLALPTKGRLVLSRGVVDWQRVNIQEGCLARIALFLHNHPYPGELRFVAEHVDEAGMRQLHKMLIVDPAQLGPLLPEPVFADNQCANAFSDYQGDDRLASSMEVVVDTACPFRAQAFQARCGAIMAQSSLQFRSPLVVELVVAFQDAPVNQAWGKARFV